MIHSKIQIKNIKYNRDLKYKAFSIVEALLAIALFSGTVTMMMTTLIYAQDSNLAASNLNKAAFIADEGLEAVKSIRNEFFTNITDGDYQLAVSTGVYTLQPGVETIGTFTRKITIDSNALDTYHKRITVEVTYPNRAGADRQVQVQTIITDWQRIILANNWTLPVIEQEINASGNSNANDLIIEAGYLYVLRSNGTEFEVYDISNSANISLIGTLNLDGGPSRMSKDGDYIYIASAANGQEVAVIAVTNPASPQFVSEINLPDRSNAKDGFFTGLNNEYFIVLRDYTGTAKVPPKSNQRYSLYAFDHSDPYNLIQEGLFLTPDGDLNCAEIYNDIIYIGTDEKNFEVILVDASDVTNMIEIDTINLPGKDEVKTMLIDEDYLFIGTDDGFTYIYSITNPINPTLLSTITSDDKIRAIERVDDFLLVGVEAGSKSDLEAYSIANTSNPIYVSTTKIRGDIKDIAFDPVNNLAYIGTTNNTREIVVVHP